jgi:tRNA(Ile)-lysidine synthase
VRFSPPCLLPALAALPPAPRLWVGFSGGLDSSVLLHALSELGPDLPAPLAALHLDHGLQRDAPRWAAHCAAVCAARGIPLTCRRLGLRPVPGTSLEAEARTARRAAFAGVLGAGEILCTAQHQDDQAETLLLQLLRGAGVEGLAAMPALMPLGGGWLARPLLEFRRAELQAYARAAGLDWIEDPSNADPAIDRNFLRHQVLPLLARRWPGQARTLARSAGHCADARELVRRQVLQALPAMAGPRPGTLSVAALRGQDPVLARALLRHWLAAAGLPLPDSGRLGRILAEVVGAAPGRHPRVAWPGAEVRRYRDGLYGLPPLPPVPGPLEIPWPAAGDCGLPPGLGWLRVRGAAGAGWRVRFGAGARRCRLPGAPHRITLKNLFQSRAVPDWLRPYIPLLEQAGEVLAVAGVARCEGGPELLWTGHPFRGWLPEQAGE